MRAGVIVLGNYSAGLEFEFSDSDAVFYEQDLFGATLEDVKGAVFIPVSGGAAEGFVFEEFDGYVAKRLVA
jgi:hypothetical protein